MAYLRHSDCNPFLVGRVGSSQRRKEVFLLRIGLVRRHVLGFAQQGTASVAICRVLQ
jgi:hypothetical protein